MQEKMIRDEPWDPRSAHCGELVAGLLYVDWWLDYFMFNPCLLSLAYTVGTRRECATHAPELAIEAMPGN